MFIAADESDFGSGYLVIDAVWMRNDRLPELEKAITEFRLKNHFWREVHLSDINSGSNAFYKRNCLEFLKIGISTGVEFKAIIVPKVQIDMAMHDNNPRVMQLNFLCTLVRNKLRTDYSAIEEEVTILSDNFIPIDAEIVREEIKIEEGKLKVEQVKRRAIPEAKGRVERHIGRKIDCMAQCSSHLSSSVQLAGLFAGAISTRIAGVEETNPRWEIVKEFEYSYGQKLNQRSFSTRQKLNIWVWRPPVT